MVMYAKGGKGRMQAYTVEKTSPDYLVMLSSNIVGNVLLPPPLLLPHVRRLLLRYHNLEIS